MIFFSILIAILFLLGGLPPLPNPLPQGVRDYWLFQFSQNQTQQRINERSRLKWLNLEFAVIALFQGIIQICSAMNFTIVFNLFIAFGFYFCAIVQREFVGGAF